MPASSELISFENAKDLQSDSAFAERLLSECGAQEPKGAETEKACAFVGGFQFDATMSTVNISYNSTFWRSPPVLMAWLDTAVLRTTAGNADS